MARSAVTLLWLGLPLLLAKNASADELPESVWLSIEDCSRPTLNASEATGALRLELSQAGMRVVSDSERGRARAELTVQLRCDQGIRATLRLRAHQDRSSASRLVSLDDTSPKDRARVLALALTELVRSDWPELSRPPEQAPSDVDVAQPVVAKPLVENAESSTTNAPNGATKRDEPAVDHPPTVGVRANDDSWHWRADALVRWFTASSHLTVGPAFNVARGRFSVGLEAALARSSSARGVANYGLAAATFGVDALVAEGSSLRFALGPRVALGATWATGQSTVANVESSDVVQLYADARVECGLTFRSRAIDLGLTTSGGRANGLRLNDRTQTFGATGGWFVGAAIGAGW